MLVIITPSCWCAHATCRYTNHTFNRGNAFTGTLDYIFMSAGFEVQDVIETPKLTEDTVCDSHLSELTYLPHLLINPRHVMAVFAGIPAAQHGTVRPYFDWSDASPQPQCRSVNFVETLCNRSCIVADGQVTFPFCQKSINARHEHACKQRNKPTTQPMHPRDRHTIVHCKITNNRGILVIRFH